MKNALSLILVLLLLLSLFGCDTSNKEDSEADPTAAVSTEAPTQIVPPTTVPEDQSDISQKVTKGVLAGDVYSSSFTGLEFTKPGDWTFATDEELAGIYGFAVEDLSEENFSRTLDETASVYDMQAFSPDGILNINIGYENTKITNGAPITADEYIDVFTDAYINLMGAEALEEKSVTLSGYEYLRCSYKLESMEPVMYQHCYCRSIGDYVNFVVCTSDSDSPEEFEAMFS
ncbi:MAG: hypothetical protein IJV88_07080 [Ruminococcus sp.]|nr:hypothetical protein [Ruminococcus sp.]